jgi:hypothetical protein
MEGKRCGRCADFRNDSAYLEALFPGLTSLSSGAASVRGDDGHCLRHDRYLGAGSGCGDFRPGTSLGARATHAKPGRADDQKMPQ